ncbi:FecCD family ABC transporter permease [Parasutterella excrementihominis]|uniref:FecCD family ABC transporter permease n=1 Tax=Parasutterella excrementihominis TaxID=487175 RepID=UPI002673CE7C|nr:iron ABC transporter permease [Parasutterella excrementihominis]
MSSEDLIIRQYRNRIRKKVLSTMLVGLLLSVLVFLDIQVGSSSIAFKDLVDAVLKGPAGGSSASFIVWEIRLPMTFTCLFVGASLSLAGLLIQTITNNPLASPYTLGVTAGASFGAAIAITTGFALFGQIWLGVSLAALVMALTVSAFIFYLGSKRSLTATTLILVGVIMNFFFQALQQYLQYRASPEIAQIISGWTFGNLQRSSWISAGVSSTCWTIVLLISFCYSWKLTALSDGTERARGLGINTDQLRMFVFTVSSVLVASAVAFIGTVAFVGLISPHCAKLLLGDDQRFLIIGSSMVGSALMLAASIISKLMSEGATLPVGIVTSIVGVPFLFFLLLRSRE